MTATIDRERLAVLKAREDELFVARHPRSLELFERAQEHMLDGVPMNWMTRWSSPFPPYVAEAHGARFTCVDGHDYVDFCLGDTGRHDRPLPGRVGPRPSRRRQLAASRPMLPTEDSLWVAGELSRRFGLQYWQLALTATDANRFAVRLARHDHEASQDPRLQLLLPRLGGRDDHHHQRRGAGTEAGERRPAGRPDRDDQGHRVERPRRARARRSRPATWPASSPSRR